MLQDHSIDLGDTANSSQSGATKRPHTSYGDILHSNVYQSSRGREKRRRANSFSEQVAHSSVDSDNNNAKNDTTGSRSLSQFESQIVDSDGLSRPTLGTRDRAGEGPEESAARLERLQGAVRTLLECVGEDPNREGLLATPERYAKAMLYFTNGYGQNIRDIVNGAIFHEHHNEMVVVKNIEIHSLCEHHLVPFIGTMHIGYVPENCIIGLSKLARIAEMFARRLQVQERLTKSVANAVFEVLQPQGVAVVMESKHLCMAMRGVEKTNSTTVSSCMIGCFEGRSKTRNEFLSLINGTR